MSAKVKGGVVLHLDKNLYPRESLESAARVCSEQGRFTLFVHGSVIRVVLKPRRKSSPATLRRLAGEFLNEALSHHARQEIIRFNRELTGPVLSATLAWRFPSEPADPLEEMEPQVALDRRAETEELLKKAGA